MTQIFLITFAYLLGSVPFGLIITKCMGYGDVRSIGSGSIGATNVMRLGGFLPAFLTYICDAAKSTIPVIIGTQIISPEFGAFLGLIAIIGHCYPIWLGFRGGKGIASMFGVMIAVNPLLFAIIGIEWLMVALTTKTSSLGALTGLALLPILGLAISWQIALIFLGISIIGFIRHRDNIKRLIHGTELKV